MTSETPDLVGLAEVAELARVSKSVISNWRTRDARFPAPLLELRAGPVFDSEQIRRYLRRRAGHMAHVVATINLKGGVGKTTTTVALAEILSGRFGKKVLVIDLDPQTNATTVLISEQRWKKLNAAGHTLVTMFTDALSDGGKPPAFDLEKTLQRGVSAVRDVRSVDLLPSSLDLIEVQDRLATMPAGRYFSKTPTDLLRPAVKGILDDYDYVLIDCPPNLGIVTLNGLRLADGYIIPTIPDVLSTYGIPQIQTRVADFAKDIGESIAELGIVVTKYREQSTVHVNTVRTLRSDPKLPPVFATVVPERNEIAASAAHEKTGTLRQKYGYGGQYTVLEDLTAEFIKVAEANA